jgi:DnaK suppressor protein
MAGRRQDTLKRRLATERQQLIQQLEYHGIYQKQNPGLGNHMADDATEVFEQAKSLALRQRLERSILDVEQALGRLEKGTYGLCESCGQSIDPARLRVIPTAPLCMECQRRIENRPVPK